MLNENEVVAAVCSHLVELGWVVESQCDTSKRGVDIVAQKEGRRLLVEAKGATSSKIGTKRYEKGFSSNQAKTHVAVAAFKAMSLLGDTARVAIALPDDVKHRKHVGLVADALTSSGISMMWVDDRGAVSWEGCVNGESRTEN